MAPVAILAPSGIKATISSAVRRVCRLVQLRRNAEVFCFVEKEEVVISISFENLYF